MDYTIQHYSFHSLFLLTVAVDKEILSPICSFLVHKYCFENQTIKGIKINEKEIKLTQFADDTTLILNGTTSSLQATLNTLEIFSTLSGLKVNMEKTHIVLGKKAL